MRLTRFALMAVVALTTLLSTGCVSERELREKEIEIAELKRYIGELENRPVATTVVPANPGTPTHDQQPDKPIKDINQVDDKDGTHFGLLSDIFFASGSAQIKAEARGSLTELANKLKTGKFAGRKIRIEGHTDSDPIRHSSWSSNQELSEARAKSVKKYLAEKGVTANIQIVGLASTKPSGGGKAKDRRVDVIVLK